MSLEGRLRDLGPLELCQLLATSRKTGALMVRAPLHALAVEMRLVDGAVVAATQWQLTRSTSGALEVGARIEAATARQLSDAVLDFLTWSEGEFRFVVAGTPVITPGALRVAMEPLLVEAMHRADVWSRVADRVPNARVVPAFVDVDPRQLPLLRLTPQEWETLTRVDGRRDVRSLAEALGRDVLDVVQTIHSLIGAGLLTIVEPGAGPPRHPTPPTPAPVVNSARDGVQLGDLWIPPTEVRVGHPLAVEARNGGAQQITPPSAEVVPTSPWVPRVWQAQVSDAAARPWHTASPAWLVAQSPVAAEASGPSTLGTSPLTNLPTSLAARGDDAARRGDLTEALTLWTAALRGPEPPGDADRIREAIALAARLHALLHPGRATSAANAFSRGS